MRLRCYSGVKFSFVVFCEGMFWPPTEQFIGNCGNFFDSKIGNDRLLNAPKAGSGTTAMGGTSSRRSIFLRVFVIFYAFQRH